MSRSPRDAPRSPARQSRRDDWVLAALRALAEHGMSAVAVEPLARRLGVTKGSFYWHFDGVDALIDAAVESWETLATDSVIRELDTIDDPGSRLRALFERGWDRVDQLRIEAALAAAAVAGDPRVRPVYLRVNRRRLAYTARQYRALGLGAKDALRWARTAYGAYLGTLHLVALGAGGLSTAELRAQARHMADALIPAASVASGSGAPVRREE